MRIKFEKLHCYSPNGGCLHFNWAGLQYPYRSTGQTVKRWHVLRFLRTKEGKHLKERGWKLYFINGSWTLVRKVTRKSPNTLLLGRQRYSYEVTPHVDSDTVAGRQRYFYESTPPKDVDPEIRDYQFKAWARTPKKLIPLFGPSYEIKNWSIRAQLLYFLNHEKELARADKKGIILYPKVSERGGFSSKLPAGG